MFLMPIYEYKCNKCEKIIEKFQNINDEPLKQCIYCSGDLKKIISLNCVNIVRSAKESLELDIKPEAKKIAEKINSGDENAAADFFGEK